MSPLQHLSRKWSGAGTKPPDTEKRNPPAFARRRALHCRLSSSVCGLAPRQPRIRQTSSEPPYPSAAGDAWPSAAACANVEVAASAYYRSTKASMVAKPIRPNITKAMNRKRTIPPLPAPENPAHTTQNRAGSAAIPPGQKQWPAKPSREGFSLGRRSQSCAQRYGRLKIGTD
jgi:hypothetical protein